MIRRPPRSTPKPSSAASDVYKRQGSAWVKFAAPKAVVTGNFTTMTGTVLNCTELSDVSNVFASNVFTAPRDGFYMVTAMVATPQELQGGQRVFNIGFHLNSTGAPTTFQRFITSGTHTLTASTYEVFIAASISGVVYLTAGQKGRFEMAYTYTLNSDGDFNYFSINEL